MKVSTMLAALCAATVAAVAYGDVVNGEPAPDFSLPDTSGRTHALSEYRGKYVVLEWINHGCPFVVKHYKSGNMQALQKELTDRDVIWLSVCSSAKGKQGYHTVEEWDALNQQHGSAAVAVLLDTAGTVGKTYGAKTTPHMYVIDPDGTLIYQGAIDDKPTTDLGDVAGARNHVKAAIDEAQAGRPVSVSQTKPYGCGVKYAN